MALTPNIGKIVAAIEAGKRAAASINRSPITTVSVMSTMNKMDIADWHLMDVDNTLFIWGSHKWGDLNQKVAK